jgi:hypothetical protein
MTLQPKNRKTIERLQAAQTKNQVIAIQLAEISSPFKTT